MKGFLIGEREGHGRMIIMIPRIMSDKKAEGVPKDVPVAYEEANEEGVLPVPPVLLLVLPATVVLVWICVGCGEVYDVEEGFVNE